MSSHYTPLHRLFKYDVIPQHIIDSLLRKDGTIYNHADVAPAPDKDFAQVVVTLEEVIFRFWKISLRNNVKALPTESKQTHADFLYDDRLQGEIHRLFGPNMLIYVRGLAAGHIDYLARMPQDLLIHIIEYLDLEDISRLAQTSKAFNKICNCDDLWEQIYHNHTKQDISDDLRSLAQALGWRKLFFTNKLQLQLSERRQPVTKKRKHEDEQIGWEIFDFAFSPYPDGQCWPCFKDGPEDYSRHTLINPRDHKAVIQRSGQEINKDDIALIQSLQQEQKRLKNRVVPKPASTFDDWGEDFSFLSSCPYQLAS